MFGVKVKKEEKKKEMRKYTVKPPKDLRSKFILEMEARKEAEQAKEEQQRKKEMEEKQEVSEAAIQLLFLLYHHFKTCKTYFHHVVLMVL